MAFETASPSPTSTSSYGKSDDNFFSPGGSPPLILTFLAIGLFTAAMIAVLGWRRASSDRVLAMQDARMAGGSGRRREDSIEKPMLWDLWTERTPGLRDEVGWDNIMVNVDARRCSWAGYSPDL
jgi:hypothetical protein